jgi:ATP-binding cassette subfamily B protein
MDQGQIVEQGKHKELLKKKGKYFELYKNQFIHQNSEVI